MRASSVLYESFVAVIDSGSITSAAASRGVPRPTLSRQLSRLEQELGVPLLHRTTRKVSPTAAGQQLYDRVKPLLEGLAAAEAAATSEATEAVGRVRVSVLPLLGAHLAPVIAHLHTTHPGLTVEIVANVRLVDLRSEGFDVAIWAGVPRDPDLIVRRLTEGHVGLVATPGYLDQHGCPASVAELADHALLRGHSSVGTPRTWWPCFDGPRFRVGGRFVTNDAHLMKSAVLQGFGIALLSDLNAGDAVQDGRLQRVLPGVVGRTAVVQALLPGRSPPTRVRAFLDALHQYFGPVGELR